MIDENIIPEIQDEDLTPETLEELSNNKGDEE